MRRKLFLLLASLLATATIAVAVQTPAHATVYWNCPGGVGCLWQNINGGGPSPVVIASSTHPTNTCYNLTGWNNVVSSASADYGSGLDLMLWDSANCGSGGVGSFYIGSPRAVNFTNLQAWFNDRASSFAIVCC